MKPAGQAVVWLLLLATGILIWNQRRQYGRIAVLEKEKIELREVLGKVKAGAGSSHGIRERELVEVEPGEVVRLRGEIARLERLVASMENARSGSNVSTNDGPQSLAEIVQILWESEQGEEADTRRYKAAEKLASMEREAIEGIPNFVELLNSGGLTTYSGGRALAFASKFSEEAFRHLMNGTSHPDGDVRMASLNGLALVYNSDFQPAISDEALSVVIASSEDQSDGVRSAAAHTLRDYLWKQYKDYERVRAVDGRVVAVLRGMMSDPYVHARINAADAVRNTREDGLVLIPELTHMYENDPDQRVRNAALLSLQHLQRLQRP